MVVFVDYPPGYRVATHAFGTYRRAASRVRWP